VKDLRPGRRPYTLEALTEDLLESASALEHATRTADLRVISVVVAASCSCTLTSPRADHEGPPSKAFASSRDPTLRKAAPR
jgi:hypothetical protein